VILPTYIKEGEQKQSIRLFPNPANDQLNVVLNNFEVQNSWLDVYNVYGQKINSINLSTSRNGTSIYNLDISDLTPGIYFIKTGAEMGLAGRFVKY
jgi:hypothetical protein